MAVNTACYSLQSVLLSSMERIENYQFYYNVLFLYTFSHITYTLVSGHFGRGHYGRGHYGRGHLGRKRSLVILVAVITVPVISVVVIFVCILDTNLMLIYDRQIIINY